MEAINLHDKYTEEIIGTVVIKGTGSFDKVADAWDKYQKTNNSNTEVEADIYDFVSMGNWEFCEVLEVNFYQPK